MVHLVVTTIGNTAQRGCCRMFCSHLSFNRIFMLSNGKIIPKNVHIGANVLGIDRGSYTASRQFRDSYLLYMKGRDLFLLLQK